MKKISIISIIILLQLVITGCPDCSSPKLYYVVNDIEAQHIDNAGKTPVIITEESKVISKLGYGINILLNLESISDSSNKTASNGFIKNISMFNNLYAECFPEIICILKDSITNIQIFTLNDFDDKLPAGSEVSNLFKIYDVSKYITIANYIKLYASKLYPYKKGAYDNETDEIGLYLMEAPTITGEHSFRIEISLSDGRTLSATTTKIILE